MLFAWIHVLTLRSSGLLFSPARIFADKQRAATTVWNTSIFPDKKSGSYLLPLKAKIRKAENIADHASVSFVLTFR
ncbi:MAG TPA: DUF1905 domain-containing protein [Candidatus Paceibacterota bacterium]